MNVTTLRRVFACLLLCLVWAGSVRGQGPATVSTIEDESFEAVPTAIENGKMVFVLKDDSRRSVTLGDIDRIEFKVQAEADWDSSWLLLDGGDVVNVALVGSREKTGLVFRGDTLGETAFPFKALRGYVPEGVVTGKASLHQVLSTIASEATDRDIITFKVDDRENVLVGAIESFADGALVVSAGGREIPLEMKIVTRIAFSSAGKRPEAQGPQLRVTLADGSRLTGTPAGLGADTLKLNYFTDTVFDIPMKSVVSIETLGGNLVKIGELTPASMRHWTRDLGQTPFVPQVDRNALRRPMVMNGTEYDRGLGVRAESEVTYKLGGAFRQFRAVIGLDDAVKTAPGRVVFIVEGDGKELFKSDVFGAGSKPAPIEVDTVGVETLSLKVLTPDGLSKGTVSDWARARLLKK